MKNVIFETGEIVEVGESRSYGNSRFYTHIELQRADGTKVRLDDVAVSLMVTPKLLTKAVEMNLADPPVATIAFINQRGQMLDKRSYWADKQAGCSFETSSLAMPAKIHTELIAESHQGPVVLQDRDRIACAALPIHPVSGMVAHSARSASICVDRGGPFVATTGSVSEDFQCDQVQIRRNGIHR